MTIHKQLQSKEKAVKIIESCETIEQISTAEKYVERYNKIFFDVIGYSQLKRLIYEKQNKWQKN